MADVDFLRDLGLSENTDRIKGIIESVLFVVGDGIEIKELANIVEIDVKELKKILKDLSEDYEKENRGLILVEYNNKVQLATKPEYSSYIKKIIKPESKQNLSQAAIETLAIIAYKQPITKVEIDEIRGVRSDRAINTLLERGLIKESGRLETTGRPILYCTTDEFLKYFGFKNINELPELIELNLENEEE
ncbi:SMC-Scp complex subunit ScpB [Thermobrachium celere]|uniref:Segregation and condensation protein B n=1 Tax=Thermobrachium celere DSM 8682 TaxID=941824 RepID=R7RPQ9_9CLOT|nr:SMC-Scp complex subunit ScpB [Thermobrachium celere]CDF58182.1 Segregation and condensation protein B [Thermobrachium celere DSM 8682]